MKNYIVLRIPNTANNGSAMMAINLIHYISEGRTDNVKFYCDFSSDEDKNRLVKELNNEELVETIDLPIFKRGNNILYSLISRIIWTRRVIKNIKSYNAKSIFVLGGDDFSEYYSGYKIIVLLYLMHQLSRNFSVFMVGHTIGPFYSWRIKLANFFLSRCNITTRDEASYEYCKNTLKLTRINKGHDLAWLDLPKQNAETCDSTMRKYGLDGRKYIVAIPSALSEKYTENLDDYIDGWIGIINKIRNNSELKQYDIVLIPHVYSSRWSDDRTIISSIMKKLDDEERLYPIYDTPSPSECRAILGNCLFSITGRMHGAISTIQQGRPSISLAYSVKYRNVIGGDIGLANLVIEAASSRKWPNLIVDEVSDRIELIGREEDDISRRISKVVANIKQQQKRLVQLELCNIIDK